MVEPLLQVHFQAHLEDLVVVVLILDLLGLVTRHQHHHHKEILVELQVHLHLDMPAAVVVVLEDLEVPLLVQLQEVLVDLELLHPLVEYQQLMLAVVEEV
jgi:hypothetical protein